LRINVAKERYVTTGKFRRPITACRTLFSQRRRKSRRCVKILQEQVGLSWFLAYPRISWTVVPTYGSMHSLPVRITATVCVHACALAWMKMFAARAEIRRLSERNLSQSWPLGNKLVVATSQQRIIYVLTGVARSRTHRNGRGRLWIVHSAVHTLNSEAYNRISAWMRRIPTLGSWRKNPLDETRCTVWVMILMS